MRHCVDHMTKAQAIDIQATSSNSFFSPKPKAPPPTPSENNHVTCMLENVCRFAQD